MISVKHKHIKGIPCLVIVQTKKQNKALPTVIYYHGFTSAKEHNLPLAYLLANEGYRILLPDSMYHGERETNTSPAEKQSFFWEIVFQNIIELNELRDYLNIKELLLSNRLGVAGTSMGGITAASALTQYEWIQSTAVLMGTPKMTLYANELLENYSDVVEFTSSEAIADLYKRLETHDLSKNIKKLANRPLLFWHGKSDNIVPANHSECFYNQAVPYYTNKNNIQLLLEAKQGHKVSRYAIIETVKWFIKHL